MNRDTGDIEKLGYQWFTSPTTDQPVHTQTKIYSPAGSMNKDTGDLEQLEYPGHISPNTDQPIQLQTKIYTPAGFLNRATGGLEQLECSNRGELDYPASTYEAALYSPEDFMHGPDFACDPEQLEYW